MAGVKSLASMNSRVLGVDPGIRVSGYGVVEKTKESRLVPIVYGTIENSSESDFPAYLEKIYDELTCIIEREKPNSLAVEEPFLSKNPTVALKIGQIMGILTLAAIKKKLKVSTYSTLHIKQAIVGYGRAEKSQVQEMVRNLLSLKEKPNPDDVADALAVAICSLQCMDWEDKIRKTDIRGHDRLNTR